MESKDHVCGDFLGSEIDEPYYARYRFCAAEQQVGTAAGVAGVAYDDDLEAEEPQALRLHLSQTEYGATFIGMGELQLQTLCSMSG